MSYSRRQLYAMGEPLGEGATRREVGGKIIYGTGGGGGNPANTTSVQTVDIPDWAKPYAKESLGKASALTSTPYQAYGGERIAQFNPMQKQAFGRAENQQVAGQVGFGTGLAGLAGVSSFGDQGTAASFMSPYMDAVVQQQMDSAQRQADIASTQRGAQAVRAGAFGGSRQAIENAEANRALASQKGQIQATGLQSAFERGQSQFNQEQATRLNAAQTLGQLGQQQFGQQMDITGQQSRFGDQQRAATQDILSQQYQDFQNQQRAPYDQLSFMSSLIRGTPMGQTTTMYAPPPSTTSQLIGLGTAAAGAYGAYKGAAGGEVPSYAAGGIASLNQPEMAAMAGGMSDEQLGQTAQMPSITELARMTLAAEAQQRAQMRQQATAQQAMMQQQPQGTVAEEQMQALGGISDLPAPNLENMGEGMASGGIIAFQEGGAIVLPAGTPRWMVEQTRLENPGREVRSEDEGSAFRAIGRGLTYSSDVEAQKDRAAAALRDTAVVSDEARKRANAPSLPGTPKAGAAPAVTREGIAGVDTSGAKGTPTARAPGAATTGIAAALPKSLQDLQAKYRTEVEAAGKAGETVEADRLAAIKRDQEAEGPIGAEREKRNLAQEKKLEGAEGKNFNMALIEAGLAIMSGNSANAFENIGKGAMVGTKAYTTGMNRIQDRREKLDESIMALDELRFGDKRASKKELRDAEAAVNKAKQQTTAALAAVTGKEADVAVDMYTKQQDARSRENVARIAAAGGGGGGGGDRKYSELTAQQKAKLRVDANKMWDDLSYLERSNVTKTGTTRDQWVEQKARSLIDGPEAASTGANISKADPLGLR